MNNRPVPTVRQVLHNYVTGFVYTLKHPLTLLPTIILSAMWIVLGILQTTVGKNLPMSVLNFISYAQGGLYGGVVGAIGGIVGKIIIAAFLNALIAPLFIKGAKPFHNFGGGFKNMFKGMAVSSMRGVATLLAGLGFALVIYSFFNITQGWEESLVGIVGIIMIIKNIGQKGGLLWSLFFSMLSTFTGGRTPSYIGITRFLSGMALGFGLGAGLNAFGLRWCLVFAAGSLVLSFILSFFGKRGQATMMVACVALALMMPLLAQNNGIVQNSMDPNDKKAQELNRRIEEAELRGDEKELERLSKEVEQYYMGQLNDAMDLYNKYKNYQGDIPGAEKDDDDDDEDHHGGGLFGDQSLFDDHDHDHDHGFWDHDHGKSIGDLATHGWADESSHMDTGTSAGVGTAIDVVGGAIGLAGGLGGGLGSTLGGGIGGGFPGGPTGPMGPGGGEFPGGGDFPGGDFPGEGDYPGGQEAEMSDEEREYQERLREWEEYQEKLKEWEDYQKHLDDLENKYVQDNGDGTKIVRDPAGTDDLRLYQDEEGTWRSEQSDQPYTDEDVKNWLDDRDTNSSYHQDNAQTAQDYQNAFEKDAQDAASHPDQHMIDDINKGMEKIKQEDRIVDTAWKHGVSTVNDDGSEKTIEQVHAETEKQIYKERWEESQKQYEYAQDELDASLKIADAEFIDTVSEGTVNTLGEIVPGGKYVKDAHNFVKAVGVNVSEAVNEGKSVGKAIVTGTAEGGLTVLQNHAGDISWNKYGKVAEKCGEFVTVVGSEGVKTIIHETSHGKDFNDALEKARVDMVKKTGDFAVGKVTDKYVKDKMKDKFGDSQVSDWVAKGNDKITNGEFYAGAAKETTANIVNNFTQEDYIEAGAKATLDYRDSLVGDIIGPN
ncbi:MAG: hypothetical protein IJS75_02355 [Bacteroidales bacterium]|nr:hypothetical protein [Bacteroidales bacterium]